MSLGSLHSVDTAASQYANSAANFQQSQRVLATLCIRIAVVCHHLATKRPWFATNSHRALRTRIDLAYSSRQACAQLAQFSVGGLASANRMQAREMPYASWLQIAGFAVCPWLAKAACFAAVLHISLPACTGGLWLCIRLATKHPRLACGPRKRPWQFAQLVANCGRLVAIRAQTAKRAMQATGKLAGLGCKPWANCMSQRQVCRNGGRLCVVLA